MVPIPFNRTQHLMHLRPSSCTQYNSYLMNRKAKSTTPTTGSPLTRLRSDSISSDPETSTSSQPARLESPRSPGLNDSFLQLTADKSLPGSPSILETLSDSNSSSNKDSTKKGMSLWTVRWWQSLDSEVQQLYTDVAQLIC